MVLAQVPPGGEPDTVFGVYPRPSAVQMFESNKLKAMMIEGEAWTRRDLRELIAPHSRVEVGWELDTLAQARTALSRYSPDVIYSAVQVRDGSAFELMAFAPTSAKVVFVSEVHVHAVRAFEVGAFDYLPKPLTRARFELTLSRLLSAVPASSRLSAAGCECQIRIPLGGARCEVIGLDHTVLITSVGGNYTEVRTTDGRRFETRRTIRQWSQLLPGELFVRTHRSSIVGLVHVLRARVADTRRIELDLQHVAEPVVVSRRLSPRVLSTLRRLDRPLITPFPETDGAYSTHSAIPTNREFPERRTNTGLQSQLHAPDSAHAGWIDAIGLIDVRS